MYQINEIGVIRLSDMAYIPEDQNNSDWLEYQRWKSIGNKPEKYPSPSTIEVDAERDRRIDAGFYFGGVAYQSRSQDRENILGAAQLAFQSVIMNLPWPEDYEWIAMDNRRIPMNAEKVVEFGSVAAQHKQFHIFAASDLKKMDPIPEDFREDKYWPAVIESEGREGPSQL